jgi:hypothetical protein
MRTLSPSPSATGPATNTSTWSFLSWAFFAASAVAALGISLYGLLYLSTTGDKQAGPFLGVAAVVGMGAAWEVALICAALGTLSGLIGVASPTNRTRTAWTAVVLNGLIVAVSLALLLILSP